MKADRQSYELVIKGASLYHPGISADCVIFGFHEGELKVLLLKMKNEDHWALPGGFILKEESVDDAATRVLQERTGINNLFLQQFHVFGSPNRSDKEKHKEWMKRDGIAVDKNNWLLQRFITVGYYALVEYSYVQPSPDHTSDACVWCDLHDISTLSLIMDHKQILDKALETLRLQINHQPIGYNLLPQKFTMPELQKLYEAILDKKLDRRNFQRRMLGYGIIKKLKETRRGGAHRAPYLHTFDMRKYQKALTEGLQGGW